MATIWSVIANRKDKANQRFWTEYRVNAVDGCPAQPGDLVMVGAGGTIDPCLLPPLAGAYVYVNGSPVPINGIDSPDYNDTTPAAPVGYTNVIWQKDGAGHISAAYHTSGVVVSFADITSGVNMGQTLVVGDGTTLTVACPGTGVIQATELQTDNCTPVVTNISHPTHPGMLLISQPGNASAAWMDPQVQGLYAAGSTICPAPAYVPPTCIQPVLIGGATQDGKLENILVTTSGEVVTLTQDQENNPNVLRFSATTGQGLVTNATATLVPLLSIRPKVGASAVTFTFRNMDFLSLGKVSHYQLLFNATLTGATFNDVDAASSAQFDVAATAYAGGRLIDAGFIGVDSRRNDFELHFGFTGIVPDTITLVFSAINGSSQSVAGCSFAWDEQTLPL